MTIRVNDLPERPAPNVVLHCPHCLSDYSATRGDYFWMPATKVFRCQECRAPLLLMAKRTGYSPVSA